MENQSLDQLKAEAAETVTQDEGLRVRVRDLTLSSLRNRTLNKEEIKQVAQTITEGISLGLNQRTGEVKSALSEAMAGLDEALAKAAEASQLALRQLVSQGRDFGDNELKQAVDQLKSLEEEFLGVLSRVADSTGSKISQEMKDFVTHARRAGTDTGAKVAATVEEFSNRVQAAANSSKVVSAHAAQEAGKRLAEAASGFFAALSDVLREKSKK